MRFRDLRHFLAMTALALATAGLLRHFDPAGLYAATAKALAGGS